MIGVPGSGAYVFYSGPKEVFGTHRATLAVPADAVYVGEDPGMAALHDVALLSAMLGMMSGMAHAYALFRREKVPPARLAEPLADWVAGLASSYARELAEHLECGDYTKDVTSNLAMMVRANTTLLRTAEEQGVATELLEPYTRLMERRLAAGHANEGTAGVVDLLLR
jgi:3-hydroxyisobutyrate dehydrogenase-like beta-hydroxyacid dehydrogenase